MSECTGGNKKRIQILLSTYNGERYLKEQLDSFTQMACFDQCKVLVRDDGSKDGTLDILHQYREQYGFQVMEGKNLGVNQSVWTLLEQSDPTCEFFAISDQDDVWKQDKLLLALQRLDHKDQEVPRLFASRSEIVDRHLHHLGYTVSPRRGVCFYNAMVQNVLPGHTQVFNLAVRNLLLRGGIGEIHVIDWWIYLVAAALGEIEFYDGCTVYHRQHGDNAVGYATGAFVRTLRRMKSVRIGRGNAVSKQLDSFFTIYRDLLPEEYGKELEDYFQSQTSLFRRVQYASRCLAYRQEHMENVLFKILYVAGKYKL